MIRDPYLAALLLHRLLPLAVPIPLLQSTSTTLGNHPTEKVPLDVDVFGLDSVLGGVTLVLLVVEPELAPVRPRRHRPTHLQPSLTRGVFALREGTLELLVEDLADG